MKKEDFSTPGQLIKTLLDCRGWTQRVLAVILGVDETGINHIISGKRPVTAEMAIMLERYLSFRQRAFWTFRKHTILPRLVLQGALIPSDLCEPLFLVIFQLQK